MTKKTRKTHKLLLVTELQKLMEKSFWVFVKGTRVMLVVVQKVCHTYWADSDWLKRLWLAVAFTCSTNCDWIQCSILALNFWRSSQTHWSTWKQLSMVLRAASTTERLVRLRFSNLTSDWYQSTTIFDNPNRWCTARQVDLCLLVLFWCRDKSSMQMFS